jgi:hypothetical protein
MNSTFKSLNDKSMPTRSSVHFHSFLPINYLLLILCAFLSLVDALPYVSFINIEFTGCTAALLKSMKATQSHRFHIVAVFRRVFTISIWR